jgi:nucleotide-binding universal stress UspA family protein
MDELPVLVGYDGSGAADAALRWAAREASSRRLPLQVVVVVPQEKGWTREAGAIGEMGRRCAQTLVEPDRVTVSMLTGRPAGELIRATEGAGLVVVGQGDQDEGPTRPMSSTSRVLAAHARCPVVVVRGASGAGRSVLPVVAGVPGQGLSPAQLDFAASTARLRQVPLVLLTAWSSHPSVPGTRSDRARASRPAEPVRELARRATASNARSENYVHDHHPDVVTRSLVVRDDPSRALTLASRRAGLLVLGSDLPRSRPGDSRAVPTDGYGAVGRAAVSRAACPVAVVPTDARVPVG